MDPFDGSIRPRGSRSPCDSGGLDPNSPPLTGRRLHRRAVTRVGGEHYVRTSQSDFKVCRRGFQVTFETSAARWSVVCCHCRQTPETTSWWEFQNKIRWPRFSPEPVFRFQLGFYFDAELYWHRYMLHRSMILALPHFVFSLWLPCSPVNVIWDGACWSPDTKSALPIRRQSRVKS